MFSRFTGWRHANAFFGLGRQFLGPLPSRDNHAEVGLEGFHFILARQTRQPRASWLAHFDDAVDLQQPFTNALAPADIVGGGFLQVGEPFRRGHDPLQVRLGQLDLS